MYLSPNDLQKHRREDVQAHNWRVTPRVWRSVHYWLEIPNQVDGELQIKGPGGRCASEL